MSAAPELQLIVSGQTPAAKARRVLDACLKNDDPSALQDVYWALRRWTWNALAGRRYDDELGEWFHLIRAAQTRISRRDPQLGARLAALSDLVNDSILFAQTNSDESLLRRNHLGPLLDAIRRNNGRIWRRELAAKTGLSDSHLSQLLNELAAKGRLERRQEGKEAEYILTDAGRQLAEAWSVRKAGEAAQEAPIVRIGLPRSPSEVVRHRTVAPPPALTPPAEAQMGPPDLPASGAALLGAFAGDATYAKSRYDIAFGKLADTGWYRDPAKGRLHGAIGSGNPNNIRVNKIEIDSPSPDGGFLGAVPLRSNIEEAPRYAIAGPMLEQAP